MAASLSLPFSVMSTSLLPLVKVTAAPPEDNEHNRVTLPRDCADRGACRAVCARPQHLTQASNLSTDAQHSTSSFAEIHTDTPIISDVFWYGVVFVLAWTVFFVGYIIAARLRWVSNVDGRLVVMGCLSALAAGLLSWLFLGGHFSSPGAFWLATITAPIAFLGFCGIFILVGPANVDRSITFSILMAFAALEGRETPTERLIEVVPFDRIFTKRLRELSTYGVVEVTANSVRLTRTGEGTRRLYLWLGRLLNIQPQ